MALSMTVVALITVLGLVLGTLLTLLSFGTVISHFLHIGPPRVNTTAVLIMSFFFARSQTISEASALAEERRRQIRAEVTRGFACVGVAGDDDDTK